VIAHLCWNHGEPDPRVLQLGFTCALAGVLLLRTGGDRGPDLVSWPVAGLLLSVLGGVLVLLAPRERVAPVSRAMSVVHIAVLGMFAAGADLGGASPLVVLPVLWLGMDLGLRGAGVAIGSVLACITVPGLLAHGANAETLERLLVLPVVAGAGASAITAGVTAARRAQARAEAREAELEAALAVIERNRRSAHAIFQAVDVGLALLDSEGRPTLMNHRLAEFSELAYPGGDVKDPRVFDESGTRPIALHDVPTVRAQHGEEFDDVRVWIGADHGKRRAMSISARRVEDSDGTMLGAAVSYTDVTEFMRALQVKDDFIALVSHELRTPLTSIVGYVQMALERDDLEPLLDRQLQVVARNALRLERLVGDLLDEVQHTRRPESLREQSTDLAQVVRDSLVAARPHAASGGVELVAEVPDAVPFTGDAQRLGQVVDNLLSNAIKYTRPGGRATVALTLDGERAVLRVRDTGIGIAPDDLDQLFTRFFRTREATLNAIQGVGLGLSITKSIVETHGGTIEVDSEPGRGSEFRVVLPRGTPGEAAA
jgi:signal transduction histidine kinase